MMIICVFIAKRVNLCKTAGMLRETGDNCNKIYTMFVNLKIHSIYLHKQVRIYKRRSCLHVPKQFTYMPFIV